jgi:uncharacterized protein (DUF1330 family)
MPAYFLAEIEVEKPDMYARYVEKATPIVERYGGRYVFRSDSIHTVSGGWCPDRMVMIEFESRQKILECFSSDEYRSIAPLREQSTRSKAVIVG